MKRKHKMKTFFILLMLLTAGGCAAARRCEMAESVMFHADFENGSADSWWMTDPDAWRVETLGEDRVFSLYRQSEYTPPVRSPLNMALIKGPVAGSFVLEAAVQSTTKDYGHRDLCLFFGYKDASHFYYAHLGKKADPHSHTIMVVDGKPRTAISDTRTDGIPWDDKWHKVRLVRDITTGRIEVFFDDGKKPVMTATDDRFAYGRIGVGSFDDTGRFDDIIVRAIPDK